MTSTERKDTQLLIPLKCSKCGAELEGGKAANVFLCRSCLYAIYMKKPEEKYPLVFLKQKVSGTGAIVYAPFWRVKGKFRVSSLSKKQSRAYGHVRPLGDLFFPAFWSPRTSYFQNLTEEYSVEGRTVEEVEGQGFPVIDGIRDPGPLAEISRLTWLGYLDIAADITGVKSAFAVTSVSYVCHPYLKEKSGWIDGITGARFPRVYLPETGN